MLRKNIRLRKEYLYNKTKELKEREHQDKLVKIKRAIESEKKVPNELRKEKGKLEHDLELADDKTIAARTHIDDEYEEAKYRDPKVLITTSRNASNRLVQFQKELKLIVPNAIRINRGGFVLKDLVKIA